MLGRTENTHRGEIIVTHSSFMNQANCRNKFEAFEERIIDLMSTSSCSCNDDKHFCKLICCLNETFVGFANFPGHHQPNDTLNIPHSHETQSQRNIPQIPITEGRKEEAKRCCSMNRRVNQMTSAET